jgi:hypothetical protein
MMKNWPDSIALLLATAWVGGLWAIGYLVAPILFQNIADKQLAGILAGKMFTWVAWLGLFCGFYLLIHRVASFGGQALKQAFFWTVVAMLLLTMASHFGIQPVMVQLKAQALPADVMQSVFADRFRAWHGVASIAYLVESLLGIILILKAR